ncbi:hypothetical protein HDU76_002052 [Blyttiomyces sp. JEL0837]|nr:hypothetical protein HDU76_002052 [Blyttiomyces sp. JEL0837]
MTSFNNNPGNFLNFLRKTRELLRRGDQTIGDLRRSIRVWAHLVAADRVEAMYAKSRMLKANAAGASMNHHAAASISLKMQAAELDRKAQEANIMIGEWVNGDIEDDGWPSGVERMGVGFALDGWGVSGYEYEFLLISCLYGVELNLETASDFNKDKARYIFDGDGGLLSGAFVWSNGRAFLKLATKIKAANLCGGQWMISDSSEYSDKAAVKSGQYTLHLATDTGKIEAVGLNETHVLMVVGHAQAIIFIGAKLRKQAIKVIVKELLFASLNKSLVGWESKQAKMSHIPTYQIPARQWSIDFCEVTDILSRSGWDLYDDSDSTQAS